jgi:hypothetical protein
MHHRGQQFLALAVAAGVIGCADRGDPLEMTQIPGIEGFASSSGLTTRERLVIDNAAGWVNTWSQIAGNHIPPPGPPAIDFESSVVIVVAMGVRPSGGFQITIDQVRFLDGDVQIAVTERSPGEGCSGPGVLTAPLDAVVVMRFDGRSAFLERSSTVDCR